MSSEAALKARRSPVDAYQRGELSTAEYIARMAEATGGRYSADEVLRIHDAWLAEEYPGVFELVDLLNGTKTVTTACLSNTNERHWTALAGRAGAFPSVLRLRRLFASHLVGVSKPDPGIYQHAERELGVAGHQILFFDDLASNVEAARRAGWLAERVDPEGSTAEQMKRHLEHHGVLP